MPRCMSTLRDTPHEGFCPAAARHLAGGNRKFPHRLAFTRADVVEFRVRAAEHMSISGIQDKISLKLVRGMLEPTETNGEYILKPVPTADMPRFKDDVPANEHVTMQVASQVFGIATPPNALLRFADGQPAYVVKRFDRRGGERIAQEDFCQLSNRSEEATGKNYKYDGTYEEVGRILKQYCKAYPVEIEKLFARIFFNYVFSNGDAHLKNFSLFMTHFGDYVLTPAYDLLCTSLHFPDEARTALEVFDALETESFRQNAFYRRPDFLKLAEIYRIKRDRADRIIQQFPDGLSHAVELIERSFLSDNARNDVLARLQDRLRALGD